MEQENPEMLLEIEHCRAWIYGLMGENELAIALILNVIDSAFKLGSNYDWRQALFIRAFILFFENPELARHDIELALESAREYEFPADIVRSEIDLGKLDVEMGNKESAENHYRVALNVARTLDPGWVKMFNPDLFTLEAELIMGRGAIQQGEEIYENELKRCIDEGLPPILEMGTYCDYGASLARRGKIEKARKQFDAAIEIAKKIGCEKRVEAEAKHFGIDLNAD
jgi:tetratricopeptide (TPR) repeat protein